MPKSYASSFQFPDASRVLATTNKGRFIDMAVPPRKVVTETDLANHNEVLIRDVNDPDRQFAELSGVTCSPLGIALSIGSEHENGQIQLWDVQNAEALATISHNNGGHPGAGHNILFDISGHFALSIGSYYNPDKNTVYMDYRLWKIEMLNGRAALEAIAVAETPAGSATAVADPIGGFLITAGNTVWAFDPATLSIFRAAGEKPGAGVDLAFHPRE